MRLIGTERAPLFEKDIELWAYPVESIFAEKLQTAVARSEENSRMKDYHDLLCLIRNDVVDIKKTKKAILDTFAHRETALGVIDIADSEMKRIQNCWTTYLQTISKEASADLSSELKDAIGEINKFVLEHHLVVPIAK